MASTRNKNMPSDYCLQQKSYEQSRNWVKYKNSSYGPAYSPALPCLGITPSRMSVNNLSYNPVQIESQLFGINSTNLVCPTKPVRPSLKTLSQVSFFQTLPLVEEPKFVPLVNQRPYPIPN